MEFIIFVLINLVQLKTFFIKLSEALMTLGTELNYPEPDYIEEVIEYKIFIWMQ